MAYFVQTGNSSLFKFGLSKMFTLATSNEVTPQTNHVEATLESIIYGSMINAHKQENIQAFLNEFYSYEGKLGGKAWKRIIIIAVRNKDVEVIQIWLDSADRVLKPDDKEFFDTLGQVARRCSLNGMPIPDALIQKMMSCLTKYYA